MRKGGEGKWKIWMGEEQTGWEQYKGKGRRIIGGKIRKVNKGLKGNVKDMK